MAPAIPTPETIDSDWLTQRLREGGHTGACVARFRAERIGTGQIGKCIRFQLELAGETRGVPRSLVGKFPSDDSLSRATGEQLGNYHREVMFYRELAGRLPIATPRCYFAEIAGRGSDFALLLEDMTPAKPGNQLAGCSAAVARAAIGELVKLHAPTWADTSLRGLDWIEERLPDKGAQWQEMYRASLAPFLARFGPALADDEREIIARVAESKGPPFSYPAEPWALVHIDFRLDNLLIDETVTPPRVAVVDWQSMVLQSPLSDLAYFLGASLLPEVRRPIERELVREYHAGLVAAGVRGYDFARCWEDYRRGAFAGFSVTVIASVIVQETARGNEMFTVMARRHARHALDLGSAEFL
jgi:aminoglycoside phosphotransferase (APT) family kinase protein